VINQTRTEDGAGGSAAAGAFASLAPLAALDFSCGTRGCRSVLCVFRLCANYSWDTGGPSGGSTCRALCIINLINAATCRHSARA